MTPSEYNEFNKLSSDRKKLYLRDADLSDIGLGFSKQEMILEKQRIADKLRVIHAKMYKLSGKVIYK